MSHSERAGALQYLVLVLASASILSCGNGATTSEYTSPSSSAYRLPEPVLSTTTQANPPEQIGVTGTVSDWLYSVCEIGTYEDLGITSVTGALSAAACTPRLDSEPKGSIGIISYPNEFVMDNSLARLSWLEIYASASTGGGAWAFTIGGETSPDTALLEPLRQFGFKIASAR